MRRFAILLAILVFTLPAVAQQAATDTSATNATTTTAAPPPATVAAPAPVVAPVETVVVAKTADDARILGVAGPRPNGLVHLGDEVLVTISNYPALVADAKSRQKTVTLWLDGVDSTLEPTGTFPVVKDGKSVPDQRTLRFALARNENNQDMWRTLLHNPFGQRTEKLNVSAGMSGFSPVRLADGATAELMLEKTFFTPFSILWLLVVLILILLLFRYGSDMLRAGPDIDGKKQVFSLARSQMAWWFVLIIAAYILIWLITGDRDTITPSLLVLMGISAATALGSVAIDSTAPKKAENTRTDLTNERAKLEATKTNLESAATPESQDAQNAIDLRVKEIDQTVANVTRPPLTSGNWLTDVLTDSDGQIALHRFQILAWTLVLGLIFVASVIRDLTMPEFNSTMLALMGISSGTYLGFKIPATGN